MLTGRLLLMLVVMTATLAVRRPALADAADPQVPAGERATWVQRLGTGVARPFSRIGLLQRVTLRVPAVRLSHAAGDGSTVVDRLLPDPLRTRLPPPIG